MLISTVVFWEQLLELMQLFWNRTEVQNKILPATTISQGNLKVSC